MEDEVSREKALQAVMAGQQAENLLDFDDESSTTTSIGGSTDRPTNDRGLISSQQISSAAKSTNPLDELMDLFSTASMATPSQPVGVPVTAMAPGGGMGGMAGMDLMSPTSTGQSQGQKKADDDLLGLF